MLAEKSGQARELYNRASLATTEIVKLWNQATGRSDIYLNQAVQSSPQAPAQLREIVAGREYLPQRLEQFLVEAHEVVPGASAALRDGYLAAFGQIVDRSQYYSEHYLGNQVPETVYLQASARRLGASAASAFGAGFGGSVWALVPSAQAEDFAQRWLGDYRQAYPEPGQRAATLITRPRPQRASALSRRLWHPRQAARAAGTYAGQSEIRHGRRRKMRLPKHPGKAWPWRPSSSVDRARKNFSTLCCPMCPPYGRMPLGLHSFSAKNLNDPSKSSRPTAVGGCPEENTLAFS